MTDARRVKVSTETRESCDRTAHLVELAIVLLLIVPGNLVAWLASSHSDVGFVVAATSTIVHNVALASLALFLVWRAREPKAEVGWTLGHGWHEVLIGVALFVPLLVAAYLMHEALRMAGLSGASSRRPSFLLEQGAAEAVLGVVMVVAVAIGEETVFRGYLLSRLRAVGAGRTVAVVMSSVIFALGHGYEGAAGMITVGLMGAVYATVYSWRGSLVAPVAMHLLQDVGAIVIRPLLR